MDILFQLIGMLAIGIVGVFFIGFGALSNALPGVMAGYANGVVGASALVNKRIILLGAENTNNTFIGSIIGGIAIVVFVHYKIFGRDKTRYNIKTGEREDRDPWSK